MKKLQNIKILKKNIKKASSNYNKWGMIMQSQLRKNKIVNKN